MLDCPSTFPACWPNVLLAETFTPGRAKDKITKARSIVICCLGDLILQCQRTTFYPRLKCCRKLSCFTAKLHSTERNGYLIGTELEDVLKCGCCSLDLSVPHPALGSPLPPWDDFVLQTHYLVWFLSRGTGPNRTDYSKVITWIFCFIYEALEKENEESLKIFYPFPTLHSFQPQHRLAWELLLVTVDSSSPLKV